MFEAAVSATVSKRLFELGRLDGARLSYLDAWKFTRSGMLDDNAPFLERNLRLERAKQCIMRRLKKPDVAAEVARRLSESARAPTGAGSALADDAVESASKECRRSRHAKTRALKRQFIWSELTMQVARGELSTLECHNRLHKEHKTKVQKRHVAEAARRLKAGAEPMTFSECSESRGRKTLLSRDTERELAEQVEAFIDARVWFHWTSISEIAEVLYDKEQAKSSTGSSVSSTTSTVHASNRFTYRWYEGFLERHGLRVTKLTTRDAKRTNSATPFAMFEHFVSLYALLKEVGFAEDDADHDPLKPFSRVLKWRPGKQDRVITSDETSVHLNADGQRKFTYVSRRGAARSSVDAANTAFRASVMGARTATGDALAPMIVTQGTYKFTSGCTATGTVLVDGELQKPVWSSNEKGSFDEVQFMKFIKELIVPAYPDLSPDNPVVYIVDGVSTHTTPAVVRQCTELGIRLFLLPPNCTHLLQGEDLVNFPVFKQGFNKSKLEYMKDLSYTSYLLNMHAERSDTTPQLYTKLENIKLHFTSLFSDAWMDAFSKKNNEIGLRIQGILHLDRYPLWKHFPTDVAALHNRENSNSNSNSNSTSDSSDTCIESNATPAASPEETSPPSTPKQNRTDSLREQVRAGVFFCDNTLTSKAVTGSPGSMKRIFPTVKAFERIRDGCEPPAGMTMEDFDAVMNCAMNTVRGACMVEWKRRARGAGAALRGELTLEQVVHRENARVQNKQPDPEREKRKEETKKNRAAYYEELKRQVAEKRYFQTVPSRNKLVELAHHLKFLNLISESVPQNASVEYLEGMVSRGWPELSNFIKASIARGAKQRKRRRGANAADNNEEEDAQDEDTQLPPLGCASCKAKATGCKRCVAWRSEGRRPTGTSGSGYPVWT